MNLPNKLTIMRMAIVPLLVVVYLLKTPLGGNVYWILGTLFVLASITDYFDGKIARDKDMVTTFGKFMDPLADKLLVLTALIILSDNFLDKPYMWLPFWIPLIVLARELIVTSIRLVAVGNGKIIAASKLGKLKTATTMVSIIWYFFAMPYDIFGLNLTGWIMMGLAILFTVVSGVDYFIKNRKIIFESF